MHEGHRDRMRQRVIENGIDSLQPHEVLEYLLFYAIPRKDTNELAHTLIDSFGSLSAVFSADYEALLQTKNMTENAAHLLSSIPQILRYYDRDLQSGKKKVVSRKDCLSHLRTFFIGATEEKVYLLCLDADNNIIKTQLIAKGQPAQVSLEPRAVVSEAMKQKAVAVILAHNHPSGKVEPSTADIEITKSIAVALELISVKLYDHYIFTNTTHFSFFENGLVDLINKNVDRFLKEGVRY